MSEHTALRLEAIQWDNKFDGDMVSGGVLYTEDSKAEIKKYLSSAAAYIRPEGGLLNSPYVAPVERVIYNMTGD